MPQAVKLKTKRSIPLGIIFAIFGVAIIVGLGITTGLLSRFVPGLGSVTVTYWGLWESDSIIRPVLDEFEKTHPGIKVNYQYQSPQEYRERLRSNLDQNKGPDVFRIHNTWTPMFRSDLSPIPSSVYSVSDYEKIFYPVARTDFKMNGQYYAVPLEIDGIAMFINDDLLNKAGISVPKNWDELRDAALAMSVCASPTGGCESGGKIIISGTALGASQNVDHWEDILAVLMMQNNVNLVNPSKPDPKPAQDVFDFFTNFVSAYRIWDSNLPSSTNSFAAGKVGIYFGPSWRVFDVQNLNPNLRFTVHPLPQLPTDPNRGEKPVTYASYWAEAVNKKSQNSAQAWELIKYLSTPDVMRKLYQQAQSPLRSFGEPYARMDMSDELKDTKNVNVFISQASIAKSWYLASYSHDGKGINTKLSGLFAEVIAKTKTVSVLGNEINKILSEYGFSSGQ
jgi:multiple sugar transport system substrate-binding protein